jgi:6-phosphogluconolactonase
MTVRKVKATIRATAKAVPRAFRMMQWFGMAARRVALKTATVLGLVATVLLTGCSDSFFTAVNNNPLPTGTSFVYVTNSAGTSGTLSAFSLASGALTQLSGSPYTISGVPTSVAVAPNNKFLLVGTNIGVFLYTINSDGTLTAGNSGTVIYIGQSTSTVVQSLVIDSTSSWMIVANQSTQEVDALSLDPTTGIPTSSAFSPANLSAATPLQVTISPGNKNVFVSLGVNGTEALTFNSGSGTPWGSTGTTVSVATSGGSDNSVSVDSTSTYVFVTESTSNVVRAFPIANFSKANETDVATGQGPTAVLADLTGAYLYVSNSTDNTISGYSLTAGVPTALPDSPFTSSKAPGLMVEDSSKTYLMQIGTKGNPNLWVYNFDTTVTGDLDVKTTTSTGSSTTTVANGIAATH